jgi:predicted regulator of Ras-like GTPase activity (Roadblock/LC7/MglB family)
VTLPSKLETSNMFNSLRKLFGRRGGATVDTAVDYEQDAPAPVQQAPLPRSVRVDAQPAPSPRSGNAGNPSATIGVPLKSIIARLAPDLMQRVRQVDIGESEIFVPTQKILTQISTGSVRISFGELRQLAPPGTFTPENDRDRTLIDLPLQEILARLNPSLFSRRPAQKHVDVPPDVVGPFGGQTKLTISNAPVKGGTAAAAPTRSRPATAGPGVPAALRAQPPQTVPPVQPAPRFAPEASPLPPTPRIQPPVAPQPIFARIRPSAPAPAPQAKPVQQPVAPVAPEAEEEQPIFRSNNRPAPTPPTPPVRQAAPKLPPVFSPIAPEPEPEQSGDTEVIQMPVARNQPPPVAAPITPIAPISEPEPEPEPIRFSAPPAEPAMPVTSGETRFITVSIAELSEGWAEAVRSEINANKLSGSWIGLPLSAVEGIIKSGKIAFPWKALRSWIKPPVPTAPSPYDTTMLELPLKVVTPLFLAELKATRAQKRYSLDEAIPDLFFNSQPPEAVVVTPVASTPPPAPVLPPAPVALPVQSRPAPQVFAPPAKAPPAKAQPAPPAHPAPFSSGRPADTNYFVRKDQVQPEQEEEATEPEVFLKKGTNTPGTAFLNRYATPNEIVSKAATLDGVDGALIALPDGLLVASRIPTNMNADTIAAFLPQIFGRVSQCTRELRLGELNNLNFTVGNVPWKIFRVGSIYFAAFGRPGMPLPTAQLVGLAAELDRKAK